MVCDAEALASLGLSAPEAQAIGWTYSTVAAAGSAITDATQITTKLCVVSGSDGSKGVIAPKVGQGELIIVKNSANANMLVYPQSTSHTWNAGTAGAAVTIAAYAALIAVRMSATDSIAVEAAAA